MKKKMTEYRMIQKYGMEGVGDFEHEYLTSKEVKESNERRSSYIQDCKLKGIYGKEYTTVLNIEHDPLYDNNQNIKSCESFRMTILNINDKNEKV